jgi:hypothetical protein
MKRYRSLSLTVTAEAKGCDTEAEGTVAIGALSTGAAGQYTLGNGLP